MTRAKELVVGALAMAAGFFGVLALSECMELVGEKQYHNLGGQTHSVPTESGCTMHFDCVDSGECRAPRVTCPEVKPQRAPWPEVL